MGKDIKCADCRHWNKWSIDNSRGTCEVLSGISIDGERVRLTNFPEEGSSKVYTVADFGCIEFGPRRS